MLDDLAKTKGNPPPDPAAPLVNGWFHEALVRYEEKRTGDFTLEGGAFDGSGHHMIGMIKGFREHHADFPLAELDFARCQELVDHWRNRPVSRHTGETLSRKTCTNHIGELKRFLD